MKLLEVNVVCLFVKSLSSVYIICTQIIKHTHIFTYIVIRYLICFSIEIVMIFFLTVKSTKNNLLRNDKFN